MTDDVKAPDQVALNLSLAEVDAAWAMPAVFANKVVLTMSGPNARLAFLESSSPPASPAVAPRAAVSMTIGDLIELGQLIANMTANLTVVRVDENNG